MPGSAEVNDIVARLRQTRANMIGTDDEQHYWDCHDAADEIERLKKIIDDYALICQSSSLELKALRERSTDQ